jgi:Fe-S-cluster containining protein
MVTEDEFYQDCEELNSRYLSAKKDFSRTKAISKYQIHKIEVAIGESGEIGCLNGCSHCCQLRVVAFPHELIAIYLHIKLSFSTTRADAAIARVKSQFAQIKDLSTEQHFVKNVECPLLENGRCSVYAVRPIACAAYHSITEEACRNSNEHPEIVGTEGGGIPMVLDIQERAAAQMNAISQVINAYSDDGTQYELIRGLNAIAADPTVNQRWMRGRKFLK